MYRVECYGRPAADMWAEERRIRAADRRSRTLREARLTRDDLVHGGGTGAHVVTRAEILARTGGGWELLPRETARR